MDISVHDFREVLIRKQTNNFGLALCVVFSGVVEMGRMPLRILILCFVMLPLGILPTNIADITSEIRNYDGIVKLENPSSLVWSEDFDDGVFDDSWNFSIERPMPYTIGAGNFSTEDGTLRSEGDRFNIASYNSTTEYGTWSFDIDIDSQATTPEIIIVFIVKNWNYDYWHVDNYLINIITGLYDGDATP